MKKLFIAVALLTASAAFARSPGANVYIKPNQDGFAPTIIAAFFKKHAPVEVVTNPKLAQYEVDYSLIRGKTILAGPYYDVGKVGLTVSFTVTDRSSGTVIYSYTVHKAGYGSSQFQAAAEAFAKHWKYWTQHRGE